MPMDTRQIAERVNVLQRETQNRAIPTPRFARKFSTWNPLPHAEGTYPQNCMIEIPRNQISELHVDSSQLQGVHSRILRCLMQ